MQTRNRPIIFVAHSLGGIVVKSALIHSAAAGQGALEEHRSVKVSTHGIVFMGTPHAGGNGVHIGTLLLNVASIFVKADDRILQHLERDSEWLQQQLGQYAQVERGIVTKFAYEMYPTPLALGKTLMIVPKVSAVMLVIADAEPIAIPADHLRMVKFASKEDEGFEKISGYLQIMAEEAPDVTAGRWGAEENTRGNNGLFFTAQHIENFSMVFGLPGAPEINQFVGRVDELAQIKHILQIAEQHPERAERKVAILHGLGGIGKTQLAITFAKQHRSYYSAVFWLNGQTEDTLKRGFVEMARRLYHEHPDSVPLRSAATSEDVDKIVASTNRWFSTRGNTKWMLIFDNVDNPKFPGHHDPQAYDLKAYFPDADQGSIIVTTRSSQLENIGEVVSVKKFQDVQDSFAILANTSRRQHIDQDLTARELIDELDGLPLALATAGAYLKQTPSTTFSKYLDHYRRSWRKLLQTSPQASSYDRALYSTWDLSFNLIQNRNESAAKLLTLWAYFNNQDLWLGLLSPGIKIGPDWFSKLVADELDFNEAIRVLCDHALVEFQDTSSGYGMHSCVHAWTRHVLNKEPDFSMARLALRCVAFTVPATTAADYWVLQRRLIPHANRCLDSVQDGLCLRSMETEIDSYALSNLGVLYKAQGKLAEAEVMYQQALTGYEKMLGPEHKSRLDTINDLGNLYANQGKLMKAEVMYQQALTGYKVLGPEHASTLDIVNNLGGLYMEQGKLAEAEVMYQQALRGYEKVWGLKHKSTLKTVNNLGNLYMCQGKLMKAEIMYQQALTGYEKVYGPEHTWTLKTVNNLGHLYRIQGKLVKAEIMIQRALVGMQNAQGLEHTSTLKIIHNLGSLYITQGKLLKAEAMYQQALTGYEKVCGSEHTSTLDTVINLGNLYEDQGKLVEAEAMYRQALKGREKVLGPGHTSTLQTVNNLGVLYMKQDKLTEVEAMFQQALIGFEKMLGPEHPSTLNTINNLGVLYETQDKLMKAEVMYQQALKGREKVLGPGHTSTLQTVNNLGVLYMKQDKLTEVEAMFQQALIGFEKMLGPEHPSTLNTINNLGVLYESQDKLMKAEVMYQQALKGREKVLGLKHPATLQTVKNLGHLYKTQGKLVEAEAMYRRARAENP
ncbi:MAG: hypothetical protein M1830_009576 [Pleopsidium flavum]|nr:MAG: hypothetical protein M1830_009576 [Pleopsidium flavum]